MRKGILPVEDEASILDDGAAVEFGVELADEVAAILLEGPPMARCRTGALVSLKATAEVIGRKFLFSLRQFVFEPDALL